jgi:hypothetical protein
VKIDVVGKTYIGEDSDWRPRRVIGGFREIQIEDESSYQKA